MKNKHSVQTNYIFNMVYEILVIFLPLVATPHLSRVLLPDGIGVYNYTRSIVVYFVLLSSFGFKLYGQREVAFHQDNLYMRSKVFWEIFLLKTASFAIGLLVYVPLFCFYGEYKSLYLIYIIYLVANMLDVTWFFQGMEEFPRIVIRNALIKILDIILIFVLIKGPTDVWKYILIFSGDTLLSCVCLVPFLKRFIKRISFKELGFKRHVRASLMLFIPQISVELYTLLDNVLLGILSTASEVGYYAQSEKIVKFLLTVVTSLSAVLMPRVANMVANNEESRIKKFIMTSEQVVIMLGVPMCIGIICVADQFIPLFLGEGYDKSIPVFKILSVLCLIMGMSSLLGRSYLIPSRRQKEYTLSILANAGTNILLDVILISRWGCVGAALTTVIAETLTLVIQVLLTRKDFDYSLLIGNVKKYMIAGLIMGAAIYFTGRINPNLNIYLIVLLGIFSYGCVLLLLKDKLLIQGLSIARAKSSSILRRMK